MISVAKRWLICIYHSLTIVTMWKTIESLWKTMVNFHFLAIDRPILVIKCHVKIPSVTLFSCLKTKHEGKLIAHSVKQPDMLNL